MGGTGESHVVAVTRDEGNPESGLPLVRVQTLPGGEWSVVDVSSLATGAGSVTPLPGLTVGYIREGAGSDKSVRFRMDVSSSLAPGFGVRVWVSVSATPAQFLGFEPKVPLASSASDLGGLIGMPAPSDPYDAAYVASIAVSSSPLFAPGVGVVPEQSIPASAADMAALTLAGYPDAAVEQARAACASFVISTELVDACALDVLVSGVDVKGPSGSSNPFVPIVGGGGDDEDSNTGQIIFFVVLAVVLAICVGYAAFVALSRR